MKKFLSKTVISRKMAMHREDSIYDFERLALSDEAESNSDAESAYAGYVGGVLQCLYQVEHQHSKRPVIRPIMNKEDYQFCQFHKKFYEMHTKFNPACFTCRTEAVSRNGEPTAPFHICMHPRTWTIGQRVVFRDTETFDKLGDLELDGLDAETTFQKLEAVGINLPKTEIKDYGINQKDMCSDIVDQVGTFVL